jgi:hypothetical protein
MQGVESTARLTVLFSWRAMPLEGLRTGSRSGDGAQVMYYVIRKLWKNTTPAFGLLITAVRLAKYSVV